MKKTTTRIEHDSLGEVTVPKEALYGAQTQRAIDNFPMSGLQLPTSFIYALSLIKAAAAKANHDLKLLNPKTATAIIAAAMEIAAGKHAEHFPIDVFQTGSGTSTNMNANEVIARLASFKGRQSIHPNDDVNMSQSSNDVIPTAIHVSCGIEVQQKLLPALKYLIKTIETRARQLKNVVKTGRTHLMDAVPLTFEQELSGWANQFQQNKSRLEDSLQRLYFLPIGGTAIGTGINAHPTFGKKVVQELAKKTKIPFKLHPNAFAGISSQDAVVELSGQLRVIAISLFKISNDLRLMNSGPLAGFGEISLPSLQPGSSIMPGKVNPVIPEAVCMVAAQVIGNDATIAFGGSAGSFQLNTMLPLIAYNALQSIEILSNSLQLLADKAISRFTVNEAHIQEQLSKNPILVTALNPIIGYQKGAEIAKKAYQEKKSIKEMAKKMTTLSPQELDRLLDPKTLTRGGIEKK
jgi:fumarate hydratase class II